MGCANIPSSASRSSTRLDLRPLLTHALPPPRAAVACQAPARRRPRWSPTCARLVPASRRRCSPFCRGESDSLSQSPPKDSAVCQSLRPLRLLPRLGRGHVCFESTPRLTRVALLRLSLSPSFLGTHTGRLMSMPDTRRLQSVAGLQNSWR